MSSGLVEVISSCSGLLHRCLQLPGKHFVYGCVEYWITVAVELYCVTIESKRSSR